MDQIKEANDKNREFAEEPEDAKLLMSFKGTSASTAVTAVTGIDGIYRFETPEFLVAFFGLAVPHKESAHKKTEVGTFTKNKTAERFAAWTASTKSRQHP
ncbi:MAG: transposase [Candidatus Methanomethylophilaceae archaeon]|nr:transposase [Candidatus Methanomethylophilaceae archaeon]